MLSFLNCMKVLWIWTELHHSLLSCRQLLTFKYWAPCICFIELHWFTQLHGWILNHHETISINQTCRMIGTNNYDEILNTLFKTKHCWSENIPQHSYWFGLTNFFIKKVARCLKFLFYYVKLKVTLITVHLSCQLLGSL